MYPLAPVRRMREVSGFAAVLVAKVLTSRRCDYPTIERALLTDFDSLYRVDLDVE